MKTFKNGTHLPKSGAKHPAGANRPKNHVRLCITLFTNNLLLFSLIGTGEYVSFHPESVVYPKPKTSIEFPKDLVRLCLITRSLFLIIANSDAP